MSAEVFSLSKGLYTAVHKCIRCGQCAYGKEEVNYEIICPVHMNRQFFTNTAGGIMQIARVIHEGKLKPSESLRDLLYLCTGCEACEVNCGVISGQVEVITLIKRWLNKSAIPYREGHELLLNNLTKTKAPYGDRIADRLEWLAGDVKKNLSSKPHVFYFVGCVSSFRETEMAVSFVNILKKLDIPFSLSNEEWCCGAPLYYLGLIDKCKEWARHNVDLIEKSGASVAVFTCPTCSMIFKKYYSSWIGEELPFDLMHMSEFVEQLMKEGQLKFKHKIEKKVIYHDPCHLGRGQKIYDPPRNILSEIPGIQMEEFRFNRENSLCCGGGGLLPAGFPQIADSLAERRAKESMEKSPSMIVSCCPGCKESLKLGAKRSRLKIKVKDLSELIDESL
ncbi:MAG: (Fe-S)-binding protein [Deltaproteobacteria bacterium]|nr:(Fe-S)-binding protein [Deltaproteobacteria bacterium]MBW1929031.1 (Fe-S)-binding protein [Deltaproteobacteria bacterium]